MQQPEIIKRSPPGSGDTRDTAFQGTGVLEVLPDGFGFLRGSEDNYQPGADDIYVSPSQIRRFDLKTGDVLVGMVRPPKEGERYNALIQVREVNGCDPDTARGTPTFDELKAVHPNTRLPLGSLAQQKAPRLIDAFAPLGKGQRALIVSPPRTGASQLLLQLGTSLEAADPELCVMAILIDARPEEVTEVRSLLHGEVASSALDEGSSRHVQIAEIAIERAKRLVEQGRDVVVLIDSLTQLARAYNASLPSSGKVLASGIEVQAILKLKRLFGAARNLEGIGSLSIIGCVRSNNGSSLDQHVLEELSAAANAEIHLCRATAQEGLYPAIHLRKSQTSRTDVLLSAQQEEQLAGARSTLNGNNTEDLRSLLKSLSTSKSTDEFLDKVRNSGD